MANWASLHMFIAHLYVFHRENFSSFAQLLPGYNILISYFWYMLCFIIAYIFLGNISLLGSNFQKMMYKNIYFYLFARGKERERESE